MAATAYLFDHVSEVLGDTALELSSVALKLAVTVGYSYSSSHTRFTDVSIHEVTNAGYPSGGISLTGVTTTRNGPAFTIDADDVSFTVAGAELATNGAVLYATGIYGGVQNPVLMYISEGESEVLSAIGVTFRIRWPSTGIMSVVCTPS